jgi:hypothetical protein
MKFVLYYHRRLSRIRPLGLFRFQILFFLKLMNLFGKMVGLLGRGIGPTQGLYLHRTTQHRKTRTHIHASSGIRIHDPSFRTAEDSTCLKTTRTLGPAILYLNVRIRI